MVAAMRTPYRYSMARIGHTAAYSILGTLSGSSFQTPTHRNISDAPTMLKSKITAGYTHVCEKNSTTITSAAKIAPVIIRCFNSSHPCCRTAYGYVIPGFAKLAHRVKRPLALFLFRFFR